MAEGGVGAEDASVLKRGTMRKLKGLRKKYFVLRDDDAHADARLEYYDSEKKWRAGARAKRSIDVRRECLNVQRRLDTRHKCAIALYTHKECFCVVLDTEEEVAAWLEALLALRRRPADAEGADAAARRRQHVWQVSVQKKGLGASHNILGLHNLCLTDRVLSLVKIRPDAAALTVGQSDELQFPLACIKRCGDSECFLYLEVGRSARTGAGELWMHTEDPNIAQSMHATILSAMSSKATTTTTTSMKADELEPKSRNRSSSANEASKPAAALMRRQTHAGTKSHALSPSTEGAFCGGRNCVGLCLKPCVAAASAAYSVSQESDSQNAPDESNNDVVEVNDGPPFANQTAPLVKGRALNAVHERTRSLPLAGDETGLVCSDFRALIENRNTVDLSLERTRSHKRNDPLATCQKMAGGHSKGPGTWGRRASTGCRVVAWLPPHASGAVGNPSGVRERCDSLPSRANTTVTAPHANITRFSGTPHMPTAQRPLSMFVHTMNQSPPVVVNSPLSPHSGACSTDSAGSSMSIDETDSFGHPEDISHHIISRFTNLPPKDQTIPEEAVDETLSIWHPSKSLIDAIDGSSPIPIIGSPKDNEYIPMSPSTMEPFKMTTSFTSVRSANHSRTSSLAEDSHVDIALQIPTNQTEDGYVDMEPGKKNNSHTMSPVGSVCSVASGTPSTDIRFSEYQLEKVPSYFTPSKEGEENRPARAYSVGSRPDHPKKIFSRPETIHSGIGMMDSSRTRAFSVGSHYKHKDNRILNHGTPPHQLLHHLSGHAHSASKSSSAPLLAGTSQMNTPSHQVGHSGLSATEPEDLMEMDFTNRTPSFSKSLKKSTDAIPHSASLQSSLCSSNASLIKKNNPNDRYLDMLPINNPTIGYVEMKPVEPNSSGNSTPKAFAGIMRKASITKSPPITSLQTPNPPSTPEGYVEMSWNSAKSRNRVSSLPIPINPDRKESVSSGSAVCSSASPIFSSILKSEEENSKSLSKVTPENPSTLHNYVFSMRKRSMKLQMRRNSKETENTLHNVPPLTLNINNANSSESDPQEIAETKCSFDAPSDALKLLGMTQMLKHCALSETDIEPNLEYMEMNPSRLSTVKEMSEVGLNKTGVDKDMKQFINNATKVFDANPHDFPEYISLNPSATLDNKSLSSFSRQNSADEPKDNGRSMPINAPRTLVNLGTVERGKTIVLSSNPLTNKLIMTQKSSDTSMQHVKKPILVKITGQTHPGTANFRPIAVAEPQPPVNSNKCNKKGSNGCPAGGSRPPSATSQGDQGGAPRSRPSSVGSELSGGSRPASVTGGLHYASLELDGGGGGSERSPRPPPTPLAQQQQSAFSYAQIDFVKSEELKNAKNAAAAAKGKN